MWLVITVPLDPLRRSKTGVTGVLFVRLRVLRGSVVKPWPPNPPLRVAGSLPAGRSGRTWYCAAEHLELTDVDVAACPVTACIYVLTRYI